MYMYVGSSLEQLKVCQPHYLFQGLAHTLVGPLINHQCTASVHVIAMYGLSTS